MATVSTHAAAPRRGSLDVFQPLWRLLTSVRFAVFYIGLLASFGLLGVLIPQVPEAMRGNNAAVDAWVESQRGTFGPLTDVMHGAGLFTVYQAKWFLVAIGFVVVNVTVCTFNRWSPTFRNVFNPPKRVPETFYDHAHNHATLAAAPPATVETALRGLRYRVEREERDGATYFFADKNPWTQLSTFVSHLALILFIAGGLVTALTGFSSETFAGEGDTAPVFAVKDPNQMHIRIDDAVGVFGERGNALDYRTHLTIFQNGEEVKSGYTTVNDPLKYNGYRFHQIAYFPFGADLRVREVATGNTVLRETFPLEETTAAPVVTITDASGRTLFSGAVAPTDFLNIASGTLVDLGEGAPIWVGLTSLDSDSWQVVAFDPQDGQRGGARIDEGATGAIGGLSLTFERVTGLPAAIGVGVPGSAEPMLAQLADPEGDSPALMLVGSDHPPVSLAEGESVVVGDYEYTFEGRREFAGIAVRRDSGAWFIWIATGMLVGGLAVTFYVPRRRLWLKLTGEGTKIGALAEKSGGFKKDMRTLADRIGVPVPPELEEED